MGATEHLSPHSSHVNIALNPFQSLTLFFSILRHSTRRNGYLLVTNSVSVESWDGHPTQRGWCYVPTSCFQLFVRENWRLDIRWLLYERRTHCDMLDLGHV